MDRAALTQLVEAAPDSDDWLHEIKFEGYRMHERLDRGTVKLLTRTGLGWTHKYSAIAEAVSSLDARQPISMANCAACSSTASPRSA
jgi:bifunctional non-homologous end joining protein LigD